MLKNSFRLSFILAMLVLVLPFFVNAQDTNKATQKVTLKNRPPVTDRPHAPSNQFIVMSYDAEQGICTFELPEDVSFITVEFTETETDWTVTETAPATDPVIHITLMPATYTVTCTTDNGSVYRGEFSTTKF